MELGLLDSDLYQKIQMIPKNRLSKLTTEELYLVLNDDSFSSLSDKEKDEKLKYFKLSEDDSDELVFKFLKIHRLNNLQIKYAHTARVVYLSNYEVNSLNIDSELVRNIVLTSALFHDVGRFYQGAFYNNYEDLGMIDIEGDNRGHAEAGYYYSLLDMLCLNNLGVATSEELIVHAIAALVVHSHQKPNDKNEDFDMIQENISFSDSINSKLFNFVLDAYLNAKPFKGGIHARFGETIPYEQKYMKQELDNIMEMIRTIRASEEQYANSDVNSKKIEEQMNSFENFIKSGFSLFFQGDKHNNSGYYTEDEMKVLADILDEDKYNNLLVDGKISVSQELSDILMEYNIYEKVSSLFFLSREEEEILNKINASDIKLIRKRPKYLKDKSKYLIVRTPELNKILNEYRQKKFCDDNHLDYNHYINLFDQARDNLAKFVQFDIVESIRNIFANQSNVSLDSEVQSLIDFCLNVVMDVDKLDILIQRVNKRWDNWNPSTISVYSNKEKNESFLNVLENVFGIPLQKNEIGDVLIDDRLKGILLTNMEYNPVLKNKITEVIDLKKDSYTQDEINNLMDLLNCNFYELMRSPKVSFDQNGKAIFNMAIIKQIAKIMKTNSVFSEQVKNLNINISPDLVGKSIPDELMRILEGKISLYSENHVIRVSYEDMKDVYPNDMERIEKEKMIILPDDLRERVFQLDAERTLISGRKFPNNSNASSNPHFHWGNVFPAIWWHLDQFIMTNMRSRKSFQFILDTDLLDRLKQTYASEECLPEFKYFIEDIVEYAKLFVSVMMEACVDKDGVLYFSDSMKEGYDVVEMTDRDTMIKIRDEACRRWHDRVNKKSQELDDMLKIDEKVENVNSTIKT